MSTQRIVLLKPSSFGDIIHTLPALAALRRAHPRAHLSWVVNAEWVPLLEEIPALDAIRVFPRHRFRGLGGLLAFRRWLREEPRKWGADLVLDFQGLLRSGLIARAIGGPRIVGLSDSREGARFFHSEVVPVGGVQHAVDRYLVLARAAGARADAVEFPLRAGRPLEAFPWRDERFVALHPFSRGQGKSLTAAQTAELARLLQPHPVVLLGRGRAEGMRWPDNVLDLLDRTKLDELIWVLRRAAFTISVDSGPMHLAAAVSPRVLGIHTWTDPRKVGPYPRDAQVWKGGRIVRVAELGAQEKAWFERGELPGAKDLAQMAKAVRLEMR
ncbi:MAG: glycosyltransferase family 9 protein [Verrucomicrobia bacterium]|nr:glycosyltransferase family 9 protein [Verrucomicrobiota bacterium]